jgi:hypothetical protein
MLLDPIQDYVVFWHRETIFPVVVNGRIPINPLFVNDIV